MAKIALADGRQLLRSSIVNVSTGARRFELQDLLMNGVPLEKTVHLNLDRCSKGCQHAFFLQHKMHARTTGHVIQGFLNEVFTLTGQDFRDARRWWRTTAFTRLTRRRLSLDRSRRSYLGLSLRKTADVRYRSCLMVELAATARFRGLRSVTQRIATRSGSRI